MKGIDPLHRLHTLSVSRQVKPQRAEGQADADDDQRPNEIADDPPVVSPSAGKGLPFIFIHGLFFLSSNYDRGESKNHRKCSLTL